MSAGTRGRPAEDRTETSRSASAPLRCLLGRGASEPLLEGWRCYQRLPPEVQRDVWDLVASGIARPADPGFQSRIRALCDQHGLDEAGVLPAVQACGFLLGQAVALDLSEGDFRSDLIVLADESADGLEAILPRYPVLKTALREAMMIGTLADHGKVLVALDWRVDRVSSSNRAAQLEADVVFLTLKYREGEEICRVTLQVTTQGLQDLRAFLERFKT